MQSCGTRPALLLLCFIPESARRTQRYFGFPLCWFSCRRTFGAISPRWKGSPCLTRRVTGYASCSSIAPAGQGFLLPLVASCPWGNPAFWCWWLHTCWGEAITVTWSLRIIFQQYLGPSLGSHWTWQSWSYTQICSSDAVKDEWSSVWNTFALQRWKHLKEELFIARVF